MKNMQNEKDIDVVKTSNAAKEKEAEVMESEATGDKPYNAFRQRLFVLLPLTIILALLAFVIIKVVIWNNGTDYHYEADGDFDVTRGESEDYYVAMDKTLVEGRGDDDTYILFLGDDILTYGDNSIADVVAAKTGATVYNCGFPGSTYARDQEELTLDNCDDVFSFISLATCILANDFNMVDYYKSYAAIYDPEVFDSHIQTLEEVDFNDVDIIFLCYGTNDYLKVHKTTDVINAVSSEAMTGSLTLGMNAIHEKYPHIRFVVVSPTYCFYTEEDGSLTSGDLRFVGTPLEEQSLSNMDTWGDSYETISGYVSTLKACAIDNNVTYLDCYYDNLLSAETADKYLDDAIHVNDEVRDYIGSKLADYVKYKLYFQ